MHSYNSPVVGLELLHQCPGKARVHRGDNTLICDSTVENHLGSYRIGQYVSTRSLNLVGGTYQHHKEHRQAWTWRSSHRNPQGHRTR